MAEIKTIADVIPFQKPQDSIFSKLINRKFSRIITFYLVRNVKGIHPTHINIASLIISLAGCAMFWHPSYWVRFAGIFVLQLGFTLDCCDGEIARIKNVASPFGAWFDSVLDRFKEFAMLASLMAFSYFHQPYGVHVLVVGFLAIIGLQLVSYLREAKKSSWPSTRTAEVAISKNIYIGTVDVTIYLVCFAVFLNAQYYMLWFFLTLSLPMIAKQLRSAFRLAKKS
ncbi:MAG: CDP-alcohol phosphatidyltransferase family protein [Candidatus Kerfeldbacteria bacterium]|nr:CDP-alcohol phosphatidyltransferase family protein [Candidatus Kerfeldbacteria bacterium]